MSPVHSGDVHMREGRVRVMCALYLKFYELLPESTSTMASPTLDNCLGSRQADDHCLCGRAEYRQAYIAVCTTPPHTHTRLSFSLNIWESPTYTLYSRSI